jgi:hypothetical protein
MAKGNYVYRAPASTSGALITPAADERIYLKWITASVWTVGTGVALTDGVAGPVVARLGTTVVNASMQWLYYTGARQYDGNPLAVGAPLQIVVTGGGSVDLDIGYEIR